MCRPFTISAFSIVAGVLVVSLVAQVGAQTPRTFRARLSPVPIDSPMLATVAGSGTVTATLTGSRLAITGSFEGLKSPATSVKLHRGIRGVRGPAIVELAARLRWP